MLILLLTNYVTSLVIDYVDAVVDGMTLNENNIRMDLKGVVAVFEIR